MNLLGLMLYAFPSAHAPKISPPAPAPPPPSLDEAAQSQSQANILRQRKGAASNVLAGPDPSSPPTTGLSKLLGS